MNLQLSSEHIKAEAKRLGFTHVVLPMKNYRQLKGSVEGIALYGAETIGDALRLAMPRES